MGLYKKARVRDVIAARKEIENHECFVYCAKKKKKCLERNEEEVWLYVFFYSQQGYQLVMFQSSIPIGLKQKKE